MARMTSVKEVMKPPPSHPVKKLSLFQIFTKNILIKTTGKATTLQS